MDARTDGERLAVIESIVVKLEPRLFGGDGEGGAFARLEKRLMGLDKRVTKLENWRWWVMGIAVGVGFVLGGWVQKAIAAGILHK